MGLAEVGADAERGASSVESALAYGFLSEPSAGDVGFGNPAADYGEAPAPRGATSDGDHWARGEADLRAFVAQSEAQAHVLSMLEAVARRVRVGDIVPMASANSTQESVLASILAALLSART